MTAWMSKTWLLFIITTATVSCAVASAPLNYNAYHYDMTTPMFTPDGRLLQVEYASLASTHSSPLLVLPVSSSDSTILMVSTKRRGQDRLVELSSPNNGGGNAMVVGMSGVLSDSVALLQKVLEDQERRFRMYGGGRISESIVVQQVATAIADACQIHAFGGGIRPYGCMMLVCGLEKETSGSALLRMAVTDPSGAVRVLDDEIKNNMVFVGGTRSMQDRIKRDIEKEMSKFADQELQTALRVAARALLKEQRDFSNNSEKEPSDEATAGQSESGDFWLEGMILSTQHGVYRLTDEQVDTLIREANEAET